MPLGTRRRGRILALQALYEADATRHTSGEAVARLAAEQLRPDVDPSDQPDAAPPEQPEVAGFARALVEGVEAHLRDIDAVIERTAPQFPVHEMPAVDRNILRLAIYEVLFERETPVRAVVNEAVELAKAFGSESSPRFVNGVLGSVAARNEA